MQYLSCDYSLQLATKLVSQQLYCCIKAVLLSKDTKQLASYIDFQLSSRAFKYNSQVLSYSTNLCSYLQLHLHSKHIVRHCSTGVNEISTHTTMTTEVKCLVLHASSVYLVTILCMYRLESIMLYSIFVSIIEAGKDKA